MTDSSTISQPDKWVKLLYRLCFLLTGYIVAMTFIGTYLQYDPVPPYDTWDIKLQFLINIIEGKHDAWLRYNFEHFYLIPRLLFLLDYKLFNCNNIFMVCCSVILVIISAFFFLRILKDIAPVGSSKRDVRVIGMLMLAMLLLWDQRDNLRSGMLIQYYPTQILMLGAFYFLHRDSQSDTSKWKHYWIAIVMAIGSVCSMANGLLTLPLMCVFALIMRLSKGRIIGLFVVTVVTFLLYGYGYENPLPKDDPIGFFFTHPLEAYHFVMLFLGHPFHYIFGENAYSSLVAFLMGQLLFAIAIYQGYRCLSDRPNRSLKLAMVCLIMATVGTATMSAGGRLYNSVMYSLVARYAVPAIYGWVALLILLTPAIIKWIKPSRKRAFAVCLVLLLTVVPMQSKAWFPNVRKQFVTSLAGLTLTLQVNDPLPLQMIYYKDKEGYPPSRVLGIAKQTLEHNLSIFSRDPYKTVIEQWEQTIPPVNSNTTFQGQLNRIQIIPQDSRFLRITGWIADPTNQRIPRIIKFLDQNNRVVGVALSGKAEPQLKKELGSLADKAGYMGYLRSDQQGQQLTIQTQQMRSPTAIQIPVLTPVTDEQ